MSAASTSTEMFPEFADVPLNDVSGCLAAADTGICETAGDGVPSTLQAERELLRKCDWHILPVMFVLIAIVFMDRINIGNAKIQGLEKDLNMTGSDFNIALFVFFPCYILLRRVRPSIWLSGLMLAWGILTICQGLTQSFAGLVVCRFFLGLAEAGIYPGGMYLISMYYKRYELQWRSTIYFSASIFAGAFGGLLAYGIAHMSGLRGLGGWRWIFILEGVVTCLIAIVAVFLIPDWPEQARFLSAEEKALLADRLDKDTSHARMDTMSRKDFVRICMDWKIWAGTLQYFGIVTTTYSSTFFLPTILSELGWASVRAQVMTIPIYIFAALLALLSALLSDHYQHRSSFLLGGILLAVIGYILLLLQAHLPGPVRYFATYLVVGGGYVAQPLCVGWLANQMGGHYKRGVALAMQVGVGNVGGILASNVYLAREAPRYQAGYGTGLGMMGLAVFGVGLMLWGVRKENGKRDGKQRGGVVVQEGVDNLGDEHPDFRYTY